ncbi:MAG: DUF6493 family protein, partial [Planctomycetaceae bacterium]|nr:DUF6493 family protein [Planctomycetaceae bacterium]
DQHQDKLPAFFPKRASVQNAFLAVKTAVLACCTRKDIEKVLREDGASLLDKEFEIIMLSRRPDWLSSFLIWIAGSTGIMDVETDDYWRIYRRFVKDGVLKPVRDDLWIRTMFSTMLTDRRDSKYDKRTGLSLEEQLHNDPELLKADIWYFFEFERFPNGQTLTSLDHTSMDKWLGESKGEDWKGTICTLVQKGELAKDRVIDGCFQSLGRPFSDYECKWYVQLLEQLLDRLKISDDELAADSHYIDLLHNANPTPRALGLKFLERLIKSGRIADRDAIPHIAGIFMEPAKGKAKKAVTLLTQIAKRSPDLRSDICYALLDGLRHEAPEIQQTSLELLLKYEALGDPAIASEVQKIAPSLAASVRKLLPQTESKQKASTPKPEKQASPEPPPPAKIAPEKIVPIATFDELLDTASKLVEQADDMDEVERFLDGVSRLGTHRPEDFTAKTDPLFARIYKKLIRFRDVQEPGKKKWDISCDPLPFSGLWIHTDIHYLIASWILNSLPIIEKFTGTVAAPVCNEFPYSVSIGTRTWLCMEAFNPKTAPAMVLFSKRAESVANHFVAGKSRQLLSTPTHCNAWIDPQIFVQRLIDTRSNHVEHDEYDKVLALLRLLPDGREEALKEIEAAVKKRDDYCNAVRYALGAQKVKIGSTSHYWIAAARCRNPLADDPAIEAGFPGYGPNGGTIAQYRITRGQHRNNPNAVIVEFLPKITTRIDDLALFPSVAIWDSTHWYWRNLARLPWILTIWPQNLDPTIATTLECFQDDLNSNSDSGFHYALAAMARPGVAIRSIGVAALFTALAMKCPIVHTTATDTLIAAIHDGRLTPGMAVQPVRDLLALDILTLRRWLGPLAIIADQSDRHAMFVRDLLETVIADIPTKESGGFLELLYETTVALDRPIRSETCRKFLESFTGSGKAAKVAKRLLAIQ